MFRSDKVVRHHHEKDRFDEDFIDKTNDKWMKEVPIRPQYLKLHLDDTFMLLTLSLRRTM